MDKERHKCEFKDSDEMVDVSQDYGGNYYCNACGRQIPESVVKKKKHGRE